MRLFYLLLSVTGLVTVSIIFTKSFLKMQDMNDAIYTTSLGILMAMCLLGIAMNVSALSRPIRRLRICRIKSKRK